MMEDHFKAQGTYEAKKQFIETVWKVNNGFLKSGKFNVYTQKRMKEILTEFIGFDSIVTDKTVFGKNFLFTAQKAAKPRKIQLEITSDPHRMDQGFRLRYHWLYDRYKIIPKKENEIYKESCDEQNIGCFAVEEGKDGVIGFINYVPPREDLPFANKELLNNIRQRFNNVGALNGFYTLKTRLQRGTGTFILAKTMQFAIEHGVDALITEANHDIVQFGQKMGWEIAGEAFSAGSGKDVTVTPLLCNLHTERTKDIIQRTLTIYERKHGK